MKDKKKIFPESCSRINLLDWMYADIAMENYYHAKEHYKKLSRFELICNESMDAEFSIKKHSVISVIFSAMCIESYLNNYAATCLGDDEFYGSFDMLSVESKFNMISSFILGVKIDKGRSYYSRLKDLVRLRNSYIHNKSQEFRIEAFTKTIDGESVILADSDDIPEGLQEVSGTIDCAEYKAYIREARNGIAAVKDIALFFDENDANAHAIFTIFKPGFVKECAGGSPVDIVLKEFDIRGVGLV